MAHDRLQDGRRIGKPGCLDDDSPQPCNLAGLHLFDEHRQCVDQRAAHRAAEAAVGQFNNALIGLFDQQMIKPDIAKFIDDDSGI